VLQPAGLPVSVWVEDGWRRFVLPHRTVQVASAQQSRSAHQCQAVDGVSWPLAAWRYASPLRAEIGTGNESCDHSEVLAQIQGTPFPLW